MTPSARQCAAARLALVLVALFGAASPAAAHKQAMRLGLGPVAGTTSPVRLARAATLLIAPVGGGKVTLNVRGLRDADGAKLEAPGNVLRLELRVNGSPQTVLLPFDIHKGRGRLRGPLTPGQQLYKGDIVEVAGVSLFDGGGVRFGTLGVPAGTRTPIFSSALAYVVDSTSVVHFTRGGDTRLKLRDGGNFNTGFDTLVDEQGEEIDHPGVTVELEISLNGGSPEVRSYSYDVVHGRSVPDGRPFVRLGFAITDSVEIHRLDVFDNAHVRFATLGLRINAPRRRSP